jgi:hypothetical protein
MPASRKMPSRALTRGLHPPQSARRRVMTTLPLLLCLLLLACGRPGQLGALDTNTTISEEDLGRLDVSNAYQAVERLRPDWLRGRGQISTRNPQASLPTVYLAGVRQQGGPSALRQIRLGDVLEMQYLNAADATTRYGIDHAGGAIIVILR